MRVGKNEFRVAFGIRSAGCVAYGCRGAIRYHVKWKAEDGTIRSEIREVDYTVAPHSADRTIAVDRQYFDTAEGAHTTDVLEVTVDRITCHGNAESGVLAENQSHKSGTDATRTLVGQRSETPPPANSN
jgi:hypothetical protein